MRPLDDLAPVIPIVVTPPSASAGPMTRVTETAHGEIRVCSNGRLSIVTTPAEVSSDNAQAFLETLAGACPSHAVTIADMTRTLMRGHDAVTALLMALRCTDASGGELWLAVSAVVGRLVSATTIGGAFPTFPTLSDALASLHGRRPDLL